MAKYKVALTMLVLCIVYLVAFYILKFVFPEILLQAITAQWIIDFGNVINGSKFLIQFMKALTTFITFFLFCCASCGRFKFKWYEFLFILCGVAICRVIGEFKADLYVHTTTAVMLLLAFALKGKLGYTAITFTIHGYLTQFLISIKGFETIILQINAINGFLLSLEAYVWEVLLTLIFLLKERKNGLDTTVCK